MRVLQLINELKNCHPDEKVQISLEYENGTIEFYDPLFVSPSGCQEVPVFININKSD